MVVNNSRSCANGVPHVERNGHQFLGRDWLLSATEGENHGLTGMLCRSSCVGPLVTIAGRGGNNYNHRFRTARLRNRTIFPVDLPIDATDIPKIISPAKFILDEELT